jgi:hypothetical protein
MMIREEDILKKAEEVMNSHPVFPSVIHDAFIVQGLTRRELFAAMAMQAGLSGMFPNDRSRNVFQIIARTSVLFADALCAELDQKSRIKK